MVICFSTRQLFRLRSALLFGQVLGSLLLRSSPSGALKHRMRYVGRLRKRCLVWSFFPQLTQSLRLHPADSLRVRVGAFPLRLSASAAGFGLYRHPSPPNNSFKPTPHRGVNSVLCATLHAVAAPPRGGLTQALGGRKAFGGFVLQQCDFTGFGQHCSSDKFSALSASVTSLGALRYRILCVSRLRKRCLASSTFPRLTRSLRLHPAESSLVRVRVFPLRLSATLQWFR